IRAPTGVVPIVPSVYKLIMRPPISGGVRCCTSACHDVTYQTTAKPKYSMLAINQAGDGASAAHASELPKPTLASTTSRLVGCRRSRADMMPAVRLVAAFTLSATPNKLGWPNVRLEMEAKNVANEREQTDDDVRQQD